MRDAQNPALKMLIIITCALPFDPMDSSRAQWYSGPMFPVACAIQVLGLVALQEPVSFTAAVEAARRHPDLLETEARLKGRQDVEDRLNGWAQPAQVLAWAGPRFGTSQTQDGFDGSIGAQQSFYLRNLAGHRRRSFGRRQEQLQAQIAVLRRRATLRVADAWLAAWVARRHHRQWNTMVTAAKDLLGRTARGVELGESTRLDEARAARFLAQTRLQALDAEGRAFDTGILLAAAMGVAPGPTIPEDSLPVLSSPPGPSPWQEDPEVEQARRRLAATNARSRAAQAASGVQLQVGAQVATETPGDLIPAATLGVTLPTGRANGPAEVAGRAEQAEARVRLDAVSAEVRRMRAQIAHEVEHTEQVVDEIERKLLPALQAELDAVERQHQLRDVPLKPVIDARLALAEAELSRWTAQARWVGARYVQFVVLGGGDTEPGSAGAREDGP